MNEPKEAKGSFTYEQDSKRFHRYKLEAEGGIVGMLYIPKENSSFPESIILKKLDE